MRFSSPRSCSSLRLGESRKAAHRFRTQHSALCVDWLGAVSGHGLQAGRFLLFTTVTIRGFLTDVRVFVPFITLLVFGQRPHPVTGRQCLMTLHRNLDARRRQSLIDPTMVTISEPCACAVLWALPGHSWFGRFVGPSGRPFALFLCSSFALNCNLWDLVSAWQARASDLPPSLATLPESCFAGVFRQTGLAFTLQVIGQR